MVAVLFHPVSRALLGNAPQRRAHPIVRSPLECPSCAPEHRRTGRVSPTQSLHQPGQFRLLSVDLNRGAMPVIHAATVTACGRLLPSAFNPGHARTRSDDDDDDDIATSHFDFMGTSDLSCSGHLTRSIPSAQNQYRFEPDPLRTRLYSPLDDEEDIEQETDYYTSAENTGESDTDDPVYFDDEDCLLIERRVPTQGRRIPRQFVFSRNPESTNPAENCSMTAHTTASDSTGSLAIAVRVPPKKDNQDCHSDVSDTQSPATAPSRSLLRRRKSRSGNNAEVLRLPFCMPDPSTRIHEEGWDVVYNVHDIPKRT